MLGGAVALILVGAHASSAPAAPPPPVARPKLATPEEVRTALGTYCVTCHNQTLLTAGIAFEKADYKDFAAHPELWERVIRKLRTGTMPPGNMPRPQAETYDAVAGFLESEMDKAWTAHPFPGRINAIHRLNRTEYDNAVHDLLAVDLDVKDLLPGDETADGSFDNFAEQLSITPAHLERYRSVARIVTRTAVGLPT
jgi:mono/diheme cytochrome c family protein